MKDGGLEERTKSRGDEGKRGSMESMTPICNFIIFYGLEYGLSCSC